SSKATVDSSAITRIVASRSFVINSLRGCGISRVCTDKEVLRKERVMPEYLQQEVVDAIRSKDEAETCDRHRNSAEKKIFKDAPARCNAPWWSSSIQREVAAMAPYSRSGQIFSQLIY
ncbi:unnamed protein product, partial [Linum tenue]